MAKKSFFLRLFIILLTLTLMKVLEIKYSQKRHPNYLYLGANDLSQHLIAGPDTKNDQRPKIFFLGSSAVAGSNYPLNSTISDYFNSINPNFLSFNLGVMQATILESYIYLREAMKLYSPSVVFLGMSADMFPKNWGGSVQVYRHLSILKDKISNENYEELADSKKKNILNYVFDKNQVLIPYDLLLNIKTFIIESKSALYGQTMSKNVYGAHGGEFGHIYHDQSTWKLIEIMKKEIEQAGGQLIIFLGPELSASNESLSAEFKNYEQYMEDNLNKRNIPFVNFSHLLESDAVHFVDYIHLTPKGQHTVANKLYDWWQNTKRAE